MNGVSRKVYQNLGNGAVLAHVPRNVRTVLDVGCGAGDNAAILSGAGAIVDGVTLSEDEAKLARRFCRNVYIHDLEDGLPAGVSGLYDCVICSHVLEHICWPEQLLGDLARVLTPTAGVLVVALPNLLNYRNRWNLLRGRFDYQSTGLMDNTHFRWYTYLTAQQMLCSNGFTVISARADGHCPLWVLRPVLGSWITRKLDNVASKLFPGLFGYQLIFSAVPSQAK